MDEIIENAESHGAMATKVCGAGGGGCIAFFCREGRRNEVEEILNAEENVEVLKWEVSNEGLVINER